MKTLYLHVGFSKTATSSFQETCKANKDKLLEQGFLYPIFTINGKIAQGFESPAHNTAILNIFSHNRDEIYSNIKFGLDASAQTQAYFKNELTKALNTNTDVILSAENISIDMTEAEINDLVKFIEDFGYTIKPFALVRAPYRFHCSSIQQAIKLGTFAGNISNFIGQQNIIQKFINIFASNIAFFPFAKACQLDKGPVGFLFNHIGVDDSSFEFIRENDGASNAFVRTQYLFNKKNPTITNGHLNPNYIDLETDLGQDKFLLTQPEFAKIKDRYDKECHFLTNKLGKDFVDEEVTFVSEPTITEAIEACPKLMDNQLSLDAYTRILQIAQSIDDNHLEHAIELMQIANNIRPHELIKLKLAEYQKRLATQHDQLH